MMTENVAFDFSRLRGRIVEKYGTQGAFAEAMGMTEGTLSAKLTSKTFFSADEIVDACNLLDLGIEDISGYFFTQKL